MASLREILNLPPLPEGVEADGGQLTDALALLERVADSQAALAAKLAELLDPVPADAQTRLDTQATDLNRARAMTSPPDIRKIAIAVQTEMKGLLNTALAGSEAEDAQSVAGKLALAAARADCDRHAIIIDGMLKEIAGLLGGGVPDRMDARGTKLKAALAATRKKANAGEVQSGLNIVQTATDALFDEGVALSRLRAPALDLASEFKTALDLLDGHSHKAKVTQELARLKGAYQTVEAHITAHEYGAASDLCAIEIPKARTATRLADAAARYDFVKEPREKRMNGFGYVMTTNAKLDEKMQEIKDTFKDANDAADDDKYVAAMTKLDEMTPLCDAFEILRTSHDACKAQIDNSWQSPVVCTCDQYFVDAEAKTAFAAEITKANGLLVTAYGKYDEGKFNASIAAFEAADSVLALGLAEQASCKPYQTALAVTKPKIAEFRTQGPDFDIECIEAEVKVLENKLKEAEAVAKGRVFSKAKVLLDEIDARRDDVFEIGRRSGAAKKAAKECREKLATMNAIAEMATSLGVAQGFLSAADGRVGARDFDTADTLIAQAVSLAGSLETSKAALEAEATTPQEIEQKKAAESAMQNATYQQLKAQVEGHKLRMEGINYNAVLDSDIAALDGHLTAANAKATAAPDPDFNGAIADLQPSEAIAQKAQTKVDAQVLNEELETWKAFFEDTSNYSHAARSQTEIDAWEGTRTTAWAKLTGDPDGCLKDLQAVERDGNRLTKLLEDYNENYDYYAGTVEGEVTGTLPNVVFNFDADRTKAHKTNVDLANDFLKRGAAELEKKKSPYLAYAQLVEAMQWHERVGLDYARREKYRDELPKVTPKVAALKTAENEGVRTDRETIEKILRDADQNDKDRQYANAFALIEPLVKRCDDLIAYAAKWAPWNVSQTAAIAKRDEVAALIKSTDGGYALLEMLESACTDASQRLERSAAMVKDKPEDAKTLADDILASLTSTLAQAERLTAGVPDADAGKLRAAFEVLSTHEHAGRAPQRISRVDAAVKKVEAVASGEDATDLTAQALSELAEAEAVLVSISNTLAHQGRLEARLVALGTHACAAALADDFSTIRKVMALAVASVRIENFDQAAVMLAEESRSIDVLAINLDLCRDYRAERKLAEDEFAVLAAHPGKFAITIQLRMIEGSLKAAAEYAADSEFGDALAMAKDARTGTLSAKITAVMSSNVKPEDDDIQRLIEMPGGTGELDMIVRDLDPRAQRDVLNHIMQARFNLTLDNFEPSAGLDADGNPLASGALSAAEMQKRGPNIKKLYELCAQSPDSLTLDNPFLHQIDRHSDIEAGDVSEARGSSYDDMGRKIVLSCGRANQREMETLANPSELDVIDTECLPEGGKETNYFTWTSQHEVGHAVDDQKRYMTSRLGATNTKFGAWEEFGSNIVAVAKIVADKFGYDPTYVQELMSNNDSPQVPEVPDGTNPDTWEEGRRKCKEWFEAAKEKSQMWGNAAACKKFTFDNRVIHEAYTNWWVSYPLDARRQGVTGYQFRAPGEWFSELYAAYMTEKMGKKHPARKWLDDLTGKNEGAS